MKPVVRVRKGRRYASVEIDMFRSDRDFSAEGQALVERLIKAEAEQVLAAYPRVRGVVVSWGATSCYIGKVLVSRTDQLRNALVAVAESKNGTEPIRSIHEIAAEAAGNA